MLRRYGVIFALEYLGLNNDTNRRGCGGVCGGPVENPEKKQTTDATSHIRRGWHALEEFFTIPRDSVDPLFILDDIYCAGGVRCVKLPFRACANSVPDCDHVPDSLP